MGNANPSTDHPLSRWLRKLIHIERRQQRTVNHTRRPVGARAAQKHRRQIARASRQQQRRLAKEQKR